MLRRNTSAPIISVMTRSSTPATVSMPSSRRPCHRDRAMIQVLELVVVMLNHVFGVVAGLVPAVRAFHAEALQSMAWMPATSAGMTVEELSRPLEQFLELRAGGRAQPDD